MPLTWASATCSDLVDLMPCKPGTPSLLLSLAAMNIRHLTFLALLAATRICTAESYQTQDDFLREIFPDAPPSPQVLWLKGDIRETATAILGHPYPGLRIRYWGEDARTAWILEEIGKEKPITVGLVVGPDGMEMLRVLEFSIKYFFEV